MGALWNGFTYPALPRIPPDLQKKPGIPVYHVLGFIMSPVVGYYRTGRREDVRINRIQMTNNQA